ncbi:tRNA ligase class II core domain protein, partial [Ostertagia ostertagi]
MRLIDVEMESVGAMKVTMPILGSRGLWEKASRWDSMGSELLRTKDRLGAEWCLQPTAEEMCTELVAELLPLKKRMFPLLFYQTTDKFRDEMSPRFGFLRARPFLMKDLYSFDIDKEASDRTYEMICGVYDRIFKDILGLETYKVPAAPGIHGGSQSHEYHLKNPLDEDGIHFCSSCGSGSKREDGPHVCECGDPTAVSTFSTVEVAHTFQLGTKYSEAIGAVNSDKSPLEMCCFGIGISRLLPAVVSLVPEGEERVCLPSVIAPFSAAVVVTK